MISAISIPYKAKTYEWAFDNNPGEAWKWQGWLWIYCGHLNHVWSIIIHLVSLKCPSLFYWRLALIGMAWLKFSINSAIELGSCEFVWMKQRETEYFKIFQSQNACDQVEIRESLRCSPRLYSCFWFTLECMSVIVFMCGFGGLILTDYCFRKQALPNNLFWASLMNWKKIIAPKWAICNCYLAACREPNSSPSSLLSLALGTLYFHPVSIGLSGQIPFNIPRQCYIFIQESEGWSSESLSRRTPHGSSSFVCFSYC